MKSYKIALIILSTLMMSLGFGTDGSFVSAQTAEINKARYSYHWFPTHNLAVYSEKFSQLCKEETKGRLEVTTYPSGQLYSARDAIAAVSQGSVEMAGVIALTLASVAPEFGVDTLMMLFDNYEQQRKAWETEPGKAAIAKMEQRLGVKLLCRLPMGRLACSRPARRCRIWMGSGGSRPGCSRHPKSLIGRLWEQALFRWVRNRSTRHCNRA